MINNRIIFNFLGYFQIKLIALSSPGYVRVISYLYMRKNIRTVFLHHYVNRIDKRPELQIPNVKTPGLKRKITNL